MNSLITLIGSMVIGALFLLSVLNYQLGLREHSFTQTNDLIVYDNSNTIIRVLEDDFRNIGAGIPGTVFSAADSDNVVYYVDFGSDGITDSVRYFVNSDAPGTSNPRDKILFRLVNDDPQQDAALGVTDFKLKYFDGNGIETTVLPDIKTIEVTLELESTVGYDEKYSSFYWQKKITPQRLIL